MPRPQRGDGPRLLTTAIERVDYSRSRFAKVIGVSRQHVSVLCDKDSDAVPSLEVAIAIEETLGVPARSWVRRDGQSKFKKLRKEEPDR